MARKPDIQYVGQFYILGSAAAQPAAQPKKTKTKLPAERTKSVRQVYVDPTAIVSIVLAAVILAVMVAGAVGISDSWQDYRTMSDYAHQARRENAELRYTYHAGYNRAEIRDQAISMGLVPVSELETMPLTVTVPPKPPQPNFFREAWADLVWFMEGLFA